MPIYEYACQTCHHEFDQIRKIAESETVPCPACSGGVAQRLVSAAGFQLKGSGWYETDFKPDRVSKSSQSVQSVNDTATEAAAGSNAKNPVKKDPKKTQKSDKKQTSTNQ